MSHVMLYLGDNKIQESFGVMVLDNIKRDKFYGNRITTIEKKFGVTSVEELYSGQRYKNNKTVYLGTILNSKTKTEIARKDFLD